ncbi:hypothetical protein ACLB2K_063300 [Fragaria x ananassa]
MNRVIWKVRWIWREKEKEQNDRGWRREWVEEKGGEREHRRVKARVVGGLPFVATLVGDRAPIAAEKPQPSPKGPTVQGFLSPELPPPATLAQKEALFLCSNPSKGLLPSQAR